ncbi:STAS/SEC14 domain-containing protein [Hymenobacter sp.]|jgi:hypothetical protein|uniref:STAS/SEC14 domain-containing protein n=1 Tax=Hymenobacter sp. TaxID=1898978 RepID=UPI002ED7D250
MKTEIRNTFGEVYLTIEFHEAINVVYNNWFGYQTYPGVVGGANTSLKISKEHNCPYMLNDNSKVVGPWDHSLDWITNDWAPRAIQAGLTHFAHIVSVESFAAFSAHNLHNEISGKLQMSIFDSVIEGLEWLRAAQQA